MNHFRTDERMDERTDERMNEPGLNSRFLRISFDEPINASSNTPESHTHTLISRGDMYFWVHSDIVTMNASSNTPESHTHTPISRGVIYYTYARGM